MDYRPHFYHSSNRRIISKHFCILGAFCRFSFSRRRVFGCKVPCTRCQEAAKTKIAGTGIDNSKKGPISEFQVECQFEGSVYCSFWLPILYSRQNRHFLTRREINRYRKRNKSKQLYNPQLTSLRGTPDYFNQLGDRPLVQNLFDVVDSLNYITQWPERCFGD